MHARSLIAAVCGLTLVVGGATWLAGADAVKAEIAALGATTTGAGSGSTNNLASGTSTSPVAGSKTAGNTASGCKQGYTRSTSTGKCVRERRGSNRGSH